jgi:hypothetical protein
MKADAKPTLDDAATAWCKGAAPPDWLVPALDFFSGFIASDPVSSKERKQQDKILTRMQDAADYLAKHLPLFTRLSLGLRCPDDVAVALAVLPKIKKRLAHAILPKRAGGQHPNVERKVCAAVVVEAWRSVHGKPEPESEAAILILGGVIAGTLLPITTNG